VRDLVDDDLPPGDICLITMTLYLMSHADVLRVLPKLKQYRYVLITDGQPATAGEPQNLDKPTDKYTRRDYYSSGFYLELAPFNLQIEVVNEYTLSNGELMRTVLLKNLGMDT
jgi:hypothetical protein